MSISLGTTFVASSQALTLVSDRWERPIRNFAGYAAVSDWRILVYKIRKPSVTFYAHKKILLPRTEKELRYLLETNKHVYIIARSRDSAETLAYPGTKLISKEGNYLLVAWTNPHNISNQNPGKRTPSVRNNSQSVSDKEHNYDGDE
jgi:hypothetical protein